MPDYQPDYIKERVKLNTEIIKIIAALDIAIGVGVASTWMAVFLGTYDLTSEQNLRLDVFLYICVFIMMILLGIIIYLVFNSESLLSKLNESDL